MTDKQTLGNALVYV